MRKFFAIAMFIMLCLLSANAQYKMKITFNDGRISDFFVSEIKDISWEDSNSDNERDDSEDDNDDNDDEDDEYDENEPAVTGEVTEVTSSSATITAWANFIDNLSNDLVVGIEYTVEGSQVYTVEGIQQDWLWVTYDFPYGRPVSGKYSLTLNKLEPSTTYSYRSFVYQSGLYFYGKTKSFTTKGQGVNLVTGEANVDCFGAFVRASVNIDKNSPYSSLKFGICYSTKPDAWNNDVEIESQARTADGGYWVKLQHLSSNTIYYYRAYAKVDGHYNYGEVRSFKTNELVTGEASNITCYSAKVSGNAKYEKDSNIKCGVCYGTTSDPTVSDMVSEVTSRNTDGSFSIALRALFCNTTYYYRTYACVGSRYEYGEVRTFQTIADNVVETGEYDEETGTVTSKLTLGSGAYSKLEVGLCWSEISETPSINNLTATTNQMDEARQYVISPKFGLGTFYYCAYVLIDGVAHYGAVKRYNKDHVMECVDLGLSVKWATCNVGASSPEKCGDCYAWGETETKTTYDWATYKWCDGSNSTMTKYCTDSRFDTVDNKTVLDPEDDVAHVKWGGDWRMPTIAEQNELREMCTWIWTTQNGKNGYKVTSKSNGNSIFLPTARTRDDSNSSYVGMFENYYWSSSLSYDEFYEDYCDFLADGLFFYSNSRSDEDEQHIFLSGLNRSVGLPVRPVCP